MDEQTLQDQLYDDFKIALKTSPGGEPTQETLDECVKVFNDVGKFGPKHVQNKNYNPPVDFFYFINFSVYIEFVYHDNPDMLNLSPLLKRFALYLKKTNTIIHTASDYNNARFRFSLDYVLHKDKYDDVHINTMFDISKPASITGANDKIIHEGSPDIIDIPSEEELDNENNFLKVLDKTVSGFFALRKNNFDEIYKNKKAYQTLEKVISEIQTNIQTRVSTENRIASTIAEMVGTSDTMGVEQLNILINKIRTELS